MDTTRDSERAERVKQERDKIAKAFGAELAKRRNAAGWSLKHMAKLADMTLSAYSRLEYGKGLPSWYCACKIADALGIHVGDFAGPRDDQTERQPSSKRLESIAAEAEHVAKEARRIAAGLPIGEGKPGKKRAKK